MASVELIQAVAVTAELCGRTFTPEAARMFVADLEGFDEPAILVALRRCRREIRGVVTVQDVVSRIDDGRPGAEEAWAMLPKDEAVSAVWTEEMQSAAGVAAPLLAIGDKVGARMAFKEAYAAKLAQARDNRTPPTWSVTLGHDRFGREAALSQSVQLNRLTLEQARLYLPSLHAPEPARQLPALERAADALRIAA